MNTKIQVTREQNNYLVELRDSGVTNMFGAAPYLQAEFGLDKYEARDVLLAWMAGPRHEYMTREDDMLPETTPGRECDCRGW